MVIVGYVTYKKGEMIIKRIYSGEIFGEIGILIKLNHYILILLQMNVLF